MYITVWVSLFRWLLVLSVCLYTTVLRAEWDAWLTDLGARFEVHDNLSNSVLRGDEQHDQLWRFKGALSRHFHLDHLTRIGVQGKATGSVHHRFERLDELRLGGRIQGAHKWGLGRQQPTLQVFGEAEAIISRSKIRRGLVYRVGLDGSQRLHQRLRARLSYLYQRRFSDFSNPVISGVSGSPFNGEHHQWGLIADLAVTRVLQLQVGYHFQMGDVVSSVPMQKLQGLTGLQGFIGAATADDAFVGATAYRVDADTHIFNVDLLTTLAEGMATLSAGYQHRLSSVAQLNYRNNIFRFGILVRF